MPFRPLSPALFWAFVILFLSAFPGDQLPDEGFFSRIPYFDKFVHAIMYGVFSALLCIGFKKQGGENILLWATKSLALLIAGGYGMAMEWMQYGFFHERSYEYGDMIANWVGAALGVLLFIGIYGKEKEK